MVGVTPSKLDDGANVWFLAISGSIVLSKLIVFMISVVIVYLIRALNILDATQDYYSGSVLYLVQIF